MIKRSRRWLLLFAALFGILAHTNGLRATSLFGRGGPSTTTTTTIAPNTTTASSSSTEEITTEAIVLETSNSTRPNLTGIPQIDYIWDPNLPRELNGLDLSDYPFLVTVPPPETIHFKCDGLHDGFYASVEYNCQLYHHCLFGIRYDFLCANFTAFDQKTFICHYASEVNCKISPKYYYRNDALYVNPTSPTTTTTTTERTTTIATPPPVQRPYNKPSRPLRRPMRRRRPQVEYYYDDEEFVDDDYEEPPPPPPRRRKQRPRNRRPEVEDDERYDRRETAARPESRVRQEDDEYERRPSYDRPRSRKPAATEARKYSDDSDVEIKPQSNLKDVDDEKEETGRKVETNSRDYDDVDQRRKSPAIDREYQDEDKFSNKRKSQSNNREYDDRRDYDVDDRPPSKKRYQDDDRPYNDRRSQYDNRRRNEDRFIEDDRRSFSNDRRKVNNDRRYNYDDPPKRSFAKDDYDQERPSAKAEEEVIQVKPSSSGSGSSVFDRPRVAPRIRRPVPVNARDKYDYTTIKSIKPPVAEDAEYYEDYEDSAVPASAPPKLVKPDILEPAPKVEEVKRETTNSKERIRPESKSNKRPAIALTEEYDDDYVERPKISLKPNREIANESGEDERTDQSKANFRANFRPKSPQSDSYRTLQTKYKDAEEVIEKGLSKDEELLYDDDEDVVPTKAEFDIAPKANVNRKDQNSRPTLRQDDPISETVERGSKLKVNSNGFAAKNDNKSPLRASYDRPAERQTVKIEDDRNTKEVRTNVKIVKRPFLPSRGGSPYLPRGLQSVGGNKNIGRNADEDIATTQQDAYQKTPVRSTEPTVVIPPPKNPLDVIYDSEYDVTLNDALSPTLKPLTPTRGSPIGVSLANKYERTRLQSSFGELAYSPSQIRRTAVPPPIKVVPQPRAPAIEVYDDYEY